MRDICERTFEFAINIVKLSQELDQIPGTTRTLTRQLLRSGTSIGANIEEGQGAQSRADFISKYSIARKEARETLYWLRLFVATGIVTEEKAAGLIKEVDELLAILTSIIKKCQTQNN